MKLTLFLSAAALAVAVPAVAQDIDSTSNSGAAANSGSISGASSDANHQAQGQTQSADNKGIGTSESNSASQSGAVSGSSSHSGAISDQSQGQSSSNSNQLGQIAANSQGVEVTNVFNSTQRKRTYNGTNNAVPLAASSSFSSDYCGGTASGGASIAPIGVSIGGAAPTFDKSCQYLRLAEKAGMMSANWHNMGYPEMEGRMMAFATWATCMAGPHNDNRKKGYEANVVMEACLALGLLGSSTSPMSAPVKPAPAPEPQVMDSNGYPTPEAAERAKTPRGEMEYKSVPTVQGMPEAAAR